MTTPQSSSIIIRKATPSDAQAIADLGTHVFTVTQGPHIPPADLAAYLSQTFSLSAITFCLQNPLKNAFVALDCSTTTTSSSSSAILGFALLCRETSDPCIAEVHEPIHLQRIYVYPHAQGQGVGKMLVQSIETEARNQGFENLWLKVYEGNHRAIAVYQKIGFKQVGTHDFVTKTAEVWTDLVMLKSL